MSLADVRRIADRTVLALRDRPWNVVKQLPSCTTSALWANPVGGRSDRRPNAGSGGDERVLNGPHIATIGQSDHVRRVEADEISQLVGDERVEVGGVGAGGALGAGLGAGDGGGTVTRPRRPRSPPSPASRLRGHPSEKP